MPQPEETAPQQRARLTDVIAEDAAARDADGSFPLAAFEALRAAGVTAPPDIGQSAIRKLLRLLADIGRGDLSVGRIHEGHVNALLLVRSYGTAAQIRRYDAVAAEGGLFGVWNTDAPDDPLRLEDGCFTGKKNFCSGVDGLSHAIVTVSEREGARRMIVVPVDGLPVDRSWWQPLGMRASGSHVVNFAGMRVEPDWILGEPDDYIRQPWFSAGAIRFAAVQVGGMHGVLDTALQHLTENGRAEAPYQLHRIARMGIAVETGYAWLDRAAAAWVAIGEADIPSSERAIAAANATRSAVERCALAVLEDAEQAVGLGGLLAPHPLERRIRDLRTYLRQPNPDGALAALGAAMASGAWSPGSDEERAAI